MQFHHAVPGKSRSRARKALTSVALGAAVLASAAACGLRLEPAYRIDAQEVETATAPEATNRTEASLGFVPTARANVTESVADFAAPRDMLVVKLWGGDQDAPPTVMLSVGGKHLSLEVDADGGDAAESPVFLTTQPVFLDGVTTAHVKVDWGKSGTGKVAVVGLDTQAHGWRIAWGPRAQAAEGIVSRAQWGADEELRFADTDAWKKVLKSNTAHKATAAEKKAAAKRVRIYNWLHKDYPEEFAGNERRVLEEGRKLIWPVEKSGYVDKIVVHHTGEWTDSANGAPRDEAAVMRGIYYYHAQVRQWGDIGYNFIVGKSGTVYEGRAGGDYAVAAHAVWNNQTSMGISLMGDYDRDYPQKDQVAGLLGIVASLSRKYGVDLSAQRPAHRECVGKNCASDGETVMVPGLSGHRDVGHTNCPGAHLYPLIGKLRGLESFSRGRSVVSRAIAEARTLSVATPHLAPATHAATSAPSAALAVAKAAASVFSSEGTSVPAPNVVTPSAPADPAPTSVDARSIRVKLSVPDTAALQIAPTDGGSMSLKSGTKTGTAKNYLVFEKSGRASVVVRLAGKSVTFTDPVRLTGDVLEIRNWKRIPAWDKTKKVNDNLFRGTLEIRNVSGKWLVINELPIGQYVRGLGEVSEGDPVAKAKTIITAARTYAAYYLQPQNRKFPNQPYDGNDDPAAFQRYLGYGLEKRSPSLVKFAAETKNVVITYQGKLIKPWYFNASTGRTRSALEYCKARGGKGCEDIPFLQGVDDPGTPAKAYNGHGVGISGNGATALAQRGWTFEDIIRYFLTGVDVQKLD